MNWHSIGQLTLPFQLQSQATSLRTDMKQLGVELSTGTVFDTSKHLAGQTGQLASLNSRQERINHYLENIKQIEATTSTAQTALDTVEHSTQQTAQNLLTLAASGDNARNLSLASTSAMTGLETAISVLNTKVAGFAVFSGENSHIQPLPSAATLVDAVRPHVAALTSADDVVLAIEQFFSDGGPFETTHYQGGNAATSARIGEDLNSGTLPTANDAELRSSLSAFIAGALVNDSTLALGSSQRQELTQLSAEKLFAANHDIIAAQAKIGDAQAVVETHKVRLQSEDASLDTMRDALIGKDPYQAATELQTAQTRLEMIYSITARTAGLSLTEYLR